MACFWGRDVSAAIMALAPFLRPYLVKVIISSNVYNPDVLALFTAAGWQAGVPAVLDVTAQYVHYLNIPSGLSSASSVALNIAAGSLVGGQSGGGTALKVACPVTITNDGSIYGGGGYGGPGGSAHAYWSTYSAHGAGGSGGAGQGFAAGGTTIVAAQAGTFPTFQSFTPPSGGGNAPTLSAQGGGAGSGGNWGQSGGPGGDGFWGEPPATGSAGLGGAGQLAGLYIDGDTFVTWAKLGDVKGRVG